MEIHHTTFKSVSYLTIWLCLLVVGYVFYLYVFPVEPVTIVTPMQTDKAEYHIGDTVKYTIDYCKHRDYEVKSLQIYLADGYLYQLPTVNSPTIVAPNGCYKVQASAPLIVPNTLPKDRQYRLKIVIGRQINLVKYDTVTYETTTFNIK